MSSIEGTPAALRRTDVLEMDELRALVLAQSALIESLHRRVEQLEGQGRDPGAGRAGGDGQDDSRDVGRDGRGDVGRDDGASGSGPAARAAAGGDGRRDAETAPSAAATLLTGAGARPTSRRALVTRGAAVAAGAAVAGTVLNVASASPAAAQAGLFDGNPAVLGMANPTSGAGVQGITTSGTAVVGTASGTSGDNAGVGGLSSSTSGFGVRGSAAATTGFCVGTYGVSVSTGGAGVVGENPTTSGATRGVIGIAQSPTGYGVLGQNGSTTGTTKGVHGYVVSPDGYGVYGVNQGGGVGVFGFGDVGIEALSARTQLHLTGAAPAPLGAGLARQVGELVFDVNHDLWLCVASGTPGTWRRVSGPSTTGALTVLASTIRIYDSRAGTNPLTVQKGIFANGEERVISSTLGGAVPVGATAVLLNATATNTNPGGFFAFFKNGVTWPGNSSLSWGQQGTTIANLAVVAVDSQAAFKARCEGVGGADLVIDCVGYYQ